MIAALTLLLSCQLVGEIIHRFCHFPLPAPVIGMVLLFAWLALFRKERPSLEAATGWLTAHLSIMFIPAAVGLIEQGSSLARYGVGLVVATVISTVLTMGVTVSVFASAARRFCPLEADENAPS